METRFPTELAERIDKITQSKGLNSNELAKLLGVTSTTIYQILNGRTKQLSMDLVTKLYQELDINMVWVTTGEGEMFTKNVEKPTPINNRSIDNGAYGQEVLNEIRRFFEEELREKSQQLNAKDQQLENKDKQIAGLQRTVDALLLGKDLVNSLATGLPSMNDSSTQVSEITTFTITPGWHSSTSAAGLFA